VVAPFRGYVLAKNPPLGGLSNLIVMNESDDPIRQLKGFLIPVSREEWYRELDHSVEIGLAEPGETYEEYLRKASRDWIVCLHNEKARP